ncbi:hypothetical protein M2G36_21620 [Vibrio vulnificus]|nr:hypothetical protein [Vibrio vulnificus]
MNVIETVTAWPVIVQGALGSALFALVSYTGQAVVRIASSKWASYSQYNNSILASQKASLIDAHLKNDDIHVGSILSELVFCSLHYIMKAVLFVALGAVVESLLPVFGFVGYLIGFIYLFKAMSYSPHLGFLNKKSKEELEELKEKLWSEVSN